MNTNNTTESTSSIIKDVIFNWVHLAKPVAPFGDDVYDIRIDVPKKREKELSQFGNPKAVMVDGSPNGMVSINLKKKALLRDGGPSKMVRVVDQFKNPMTLEQIASIGNGSKGNVMVMQKPFEIKGPSGKVTKSGVSTMLLAIQVMTLVKYEPKMSGIDFDSIDNFDDLPGKTADDSDEF